MNGVCSLYVPEGTVETYKASDFGRMFREIIENTMSDINNVSEDVSNQSTIDIYSTDGILLYKGAINEPNLPTGIYIKKQGTKISKYIVK